MKIAYYLYFIFNSILIVPPLYTWILKINYQLDKLENLVLKELLDLLDLLDKPENRERNVDLNFFE